MKDANNRNKRRNYRADSHELKLAGIDYNIGPDAEDRLRRIFTILLRHAARDRQATTKKDAHIDAVNCKNHAGEEA
ncbi:MAG: hypothetical protein OXD46_06870 [Chloroflexi bacterium]|nr:hypothetical protein [Chloroflexota bacterium]